MGDHVMNETVLIVDDDPAICYTVREVLAAAGLQARIAQSGEVCLQALREGFRGVILLDIMMPGKDGWQTLQEMRAEGLLEGNIICMLTAVTNPGQRMEHLKECVLDYVRKPFDPDGLVRATCQYIDYLQPVADGVGEQD
jgi:DNA-binding response OmpR family regulator